MRKFPLGVCPVQASYAAVASPVTHAGNIQPFGNGLSPCGRIVRGRLRPSVLPPRCVLGCLDWMGSSWLCTNRTERLKSP